MECNIIICGIGGQGVILAGDILSNVLFKEGYDIKKSEIKGMSKRGGSVVCHIRFGKKIFSPLIKKRSANFILSLERLEALYYKDYVNENSRVIINDFEYKKGLSYPKNIEKKLRKEYKKIYFVPATKIAKGIGNLMLSNVVLLGYLSNFLDIDEKVWFSIMDSIFKNNKIREINKKAFLLGKQIKEKI